MSHLVPHSHDSSGKVDGALESSAAGIRAVKISLPMPVREALLRLMAGVAPRQTGNLPILNPRRTRRTV